MYRVPDRATLTPSSRFASRGPPPVPDTVLIATDFADEIVKTLQPRFERQRFELARRPEDVAPALDRYRPSVVFSIKHSGFAASALRGVVGHPSVRWAHVGGSGYEHLGPWNPKEVVVTNSAGVLAPFLAHTTIGALIALNGNFTAYATQQRERRWAPVPFRALSGQTLLVVGLGRIGTLVAGHARSLGMHVTAVRGNPGPSDAAHEVHGPGALDELLERADVVSLHVRASAETRHLMSAERFARMKPEALFINTSRGSVVDEGALARALGEGWIRGAYLDVFEIEPLPPESGLWSLPNLMITPHASDNVDDWPLRLAASFAANLERWQAGERLENVVDPIGPA